uniref:Uncharacterized protein n=1 Tax=Lactuca sativa TaxID=4236 RepID=A0A9R1XT54_LACSA|nr:hypothetical protein LSAT_V11C100039610 [Lactuca sativa]
MVVTAGMLHVFGEDVAELPMVAISETNRWKRLLRYPKVKKMVVPVAEDVKSTKIQKFAEGIETNIDINGSILKNIFVRKGGGGASSAVTFEDGFGFSLSMEK